jgi:UDP-glucose 4-epimerase
MNQVMQGKPMTVFGDGLQTRAFSYIDDVAPVIARSPEVGGAYDEVYNIGADTPYSVLELSRQVAAAFGVGHRVHYLSARNEVVHAFSSHAKVQKAFQTPVPVVLEKGITKMAAWAKAKGPMTPVRFGGVEVKKNLPPSWR